MPIAIMKKLILIIVEGRSDEVYLYPVKRLVKSCSNNRVEFKVMRGDILVETSTNSKNIIEKVESTIKEYLKLYGLEYDDVKQVVHIVDLDGSFISPDQVETDSSLTKGKTLYYRDKITNVSRNNIIQRNKKKVDCLNVLYNIDSVNHGTLPYRVYYFSTNIDDYFYGKQNLTTEEKNHFLI